MFIICLFENFGKHLGVMWLNGVTWRTLCGHMFVSLANLVLESTERLTMPNIETNDKTCQ